MHFWRELKYFILEVRNRYPRQKLDEELYKSNLPIFEPPKMPKKGEYGGEVNK